MVRHGTHVLLLTAMLTPGVGCAGGGVDGGDDDDVIIDTDGDADVDADSDADGDIDTSCEDAARTVNRICAPFQIGFLEDRCDLYIELSQGECLSAYRDYLACVASMTECTAEGPVGCGAEAEAAETACANGCLDIVSCLGECPEEDEACMEACIEAGAPAGQSALLALIRCVDRHCAEVDPEDEQATVACWDEHCEAEFVGCR